VYTRSIKMGMCNTYGRPKAKHPDKALARMHASKLNKGRIHKSEAYKCYHCGFWHAGRIPKALELRRIQRREDARDDMLVGKLIAVLKIVINSNKEGLS
jgi:hypothetical protein